MTNPSARSTTRINVVTDKRRLPQDAPADPYTHRPADQPPQEIQSPEPEQSPKKRKTAKVRPPLPEWLLASKSQESDPFGSLYWRLYASLRLYRFRGLPVPKPAVNYEKMVYQLRQEMQAIRQAVMSIIVVISVKGGASKTTVTTWLAAIIADVLKGGFAVIDTDGGGGKAARRFGLNSNAALSTAALLSMDKSKAIPNYAALVEATVTDPQTGLTFFHSNPSVGLTARGMKSTLLRLKKEFHSIIVDTGPGFRVNATNGSVAVSSVPIIVGLGLSDEDMDDIKETLDESAYHLRERIDDVQIVINGCERKDYNLRTQYELAERFGVRPYQISLLPYNLYLKLKKQVRLSSLDKRTMYAWYNLASEVTKRAQAYNARRHDLENIEVPEVSDDDSSDISPV